MWWSDAELELLVGSSAYGEASKLRKECDDLCQRLCRNGSGELAEEVEAHGRDAVDEAVKAAYVSILSRAFKMVGEGEQEGEEVMTMIPVLDLLQHGAVPSVDYAVEEEEETETDDDEGGGGGGGGGGEEFIVARAVGDVVAGSELVITYGSHPDMVFGTHYGFVPPLEEQRASCCTILRLRPLGDEDLFCLGLGADAVLNAQSDVDEGCFDDSDEWDVDKVLERPRRALATLLATAGGASCFPLEFGLSIEDLDALVGVEFDDRVSGDGASASSGERALSLRISARLCALDDDGSGDSWEEQADAATKRVLLQGSLDLANDVDAAVLITVVARSQMAALLDAEARAEKEKDEEDGGANNDAWGEEGTIRAICVSMAKALRTSEKVALTRLCSGSDVGAIFDIDTDAIEGWDDLLMQSVEDLCLRIERLDDIP